MRLPRVGKVGLVLASFIVLAMATSPATTPTASQSAAPPTTQAQSQPKADKVEKKTVTETKPVPFTVATINDAALAQGTTKVTTAGVDGVETLTYEVTLTNGAQTDKKLVSDTVTTQPIAQVTSIGTYIAPPQPTGCTNGTYVNSAGNTVCSPETSPSAPAGATAQCVDGTYSFSQTRSGTCSHHGGVAQWL